MCLAGSESLLGLLFEEPKRTLFDQTNIMSFFFQNWFGCETALGHIMPNFKSSFQYYSCLIRMLY